MTCQKITPIGAFLATVLLAIFPSPLRADDQNPKISKNPAGYSLDWSGNPGRTYFVQMTTNLQQWHYFPEIYSGDGSLLSHGFNTNAPRLFTRLIWTDLPDGGDPSAADFDNDGLATQEELTSAERTDPLNPDTDGDGLRDGWERTHGFNPVSTDSDGNGTPDGAEDPDGDGFNNETEQNSNSDPSDNADRPSPNGGTSAFSVLLDLDVDSDNNNGFENPDRSLLEDVLEASEPKVLFPNNADSDNDGLIDFADGFNLAGFSSSGTTGPSLRFTPVLVELGGQFDPLKARVKFTYSPMSEPRLGGGLGLDEGGKPIVVQGGLRLWNCPADSRENGDPIADGAMPKGDFIPSDTEINWREIVSADGQRLSTLYLEYVDTPAFPEIGTIVDLKVEVSQPNEDAAGTASETLTEEDIVQIGLLTVNLTVDKTMLTLLEENTLQIEGADRFPNGLLDGVKFEIKRDGEATWHEIQDGAAIEFKGKARVAGKFKVRATLDLNGKEVQTEEEAIEICFPTANEILAGNGVNARMDQAWQNTIQNTTDNSRREEGYYITLDTKTETWDIAGYTVGNVIKDNQDPPRVDGLGAAKPDDIPKNPKPLDQPRYTVGWFHTHTPEFHRNAVDDFGDPPGTIRARDSGPSQGDRDFAANTVELPGFVYDYVGVQIANFQDQVPFCHPLNAPAKITEITPPQKRKTP